jgi:hypothetical protein
MFLEGATRVSIPSHTTYIVRAGRTERYAASLHFLSVLLLPVVGPPNVVSLTLLSLEWFSLTQNVTDPLRGIVLESMPSTLHRGQPSSYPLRDLENGPRRRDSNDGTSSATSTSTPSSPVEHTAFVYESYLVKGPRWRLLEWANGPQPPRPYILVPFGGSIQLVPIKTLHTWLPRHRDRLWVMFAFYALWLLLFVWIIHAGNGDRADSPQRLSCISRLWSAISLIRGA